MRNSFRNVLINSTLAFIAAFIITTVIHELGHYLSYLLFGAHPTLFHNYVQIPDQQLSMRAIIVSALAGPVISLVQGIIFGSVVSSGNKNTVSYLFMIWLSLLGFVNFFGYLMMTPFSITGDTGKVAELIHIDYSIRILIAAFGFAILLWLIFKIAKNFSKFIPVQYDRDIRVKYVYQLMFYPIVIGSIVNTLFSFPVIALLSVIYPATSSFVIMSSFRAIIRTSRSDSSVSEFEGKIMKSMVLLVLCVIILNRILTLGIG